MNSLLIHHYTKSIRLTPDGFSLYGEAKGDTLRHTYHANAENALLTLKAPEFFGLSADAEATLDVIVATRPPLLVPDVIFDESKVRDYLRMQFDISQIGEHFCDTLGHYRSLYFLTQNELTALSGLPCKLQYKSEATLLYQFLQSQGESNAVLLSVNDTFADILAVQNGEPLLVNRTTHVENVDLLYHTLNSVQQLGMADPTLFVHYFTKPNKKLNDLLARYLDHIIIL